MFKTKGFIALCGIIWCFGVWLLQILAIYKASMSGESSYMYQAFAIALGFCVGMNAFCFWLANRSPVVTLEFRFAGRMEERPDGLYLVYPDGTAARFARRVSRPKPNWKKEGF